MISEPLSNNPRIYIIHFHSLFIVNSHYNGFVQARDNKYNNICITGNGQQTNKLVNKQFNWWSVKKRPEPPATILKKHSVPYKKGSRPFQGLCGES